MKIGFLAHGPGSANALLPLIDIFRERHQVFLYAFHPFANKLWNCELKTIEEYQDVFHSGIDVLFYGTGSGHDIELQVPLFAQKQGIVSISILDIFWSDTENLKFRYSTYPPDYLIVPTKSCKEKLSALNIMDSDSILVLGNPHFDRLQTFSSTVKNRKTPYDIVLFSQPTTSEDFSETSPLVKECLEALVVLNGPEKECISSITVTPHPRESLEWLSSFCNFHKIDLELEKNSFEVLLEKELSIGVNCTVQYESEMIGIPTIFFVNADDLEEKINSLEHWEPNNDYAVKNATKNIFDWFGEREESFCNTKNR